MIQDSNVQYFNFSESTIYNGKRNKTKITKLYAKIQTNQPTQIALMFNYVQFYNTVICHKTTV